MATYNNEEGVWRTIGGRRVFIRTGQSLSDAMIESGKFSRVKKNEELYKKLGEEKQEKKKDISSTDAIDELMNADTGDWNNMNQAERDKTCEKILQDFEDKYGDKLKDEKFREEVLDGLEDQNFHTMGRIIEQKYEYSNDPVLSDLDKRMQDVKLKQDAVNKSFEENQKELQARLNNDDISPMSEYSDTIGDGLTDAQRKEVREAVKSSYIYKDEKSSQEYIERYKKEYGDKAVQDAFDYYDENYVVVKGTIADSEGLTYNSLIDKKDYSQEAIENYKRGIDTLRNSGLQYRSSSEYNAKADALLKELEASKNQDTFTSKSTNPFYSDTTYTKEQLDKMNENGVKPMKNTYSGSGWKGVNADKNLSTKEQAKAITDAMKKQYPDVKISRKSDIFSGGSSIDFNIMSSDKDLYISDADIDKMSDFGRLSTGYGFENWAEKNVNGFKRYTNEVYTTDDVRKYAKEVLSDLKKRDNQNVSGDEWYLSDYGKKVVSELNKQANSYTYDDSDAMTDYFNHGTYMHISIGKWDKPYQVNQKVAAKTMNDVIREKAFQKYKKEHPGTEKTLEDFM